MNDRVYIVSGGHHDDLSFKTIDSRNFRFEIFNTYGDAYDYWKAQSWQNVDDAQFRLTISPTRVVEDVDSHLARDGDVIIADIPPEVVDEILGIDLESLQGLTG